MLFLKTSNNSYAIKQYVDSTVNFTEEFNMEALIVLDESTVDFPNLVNDLSNEPKMDIVNSNQDVLVTYTQDNPFEVERVYRDDDGVMEIRVRHLYNT